jgi:alkylation response protein AidB-like acyl-CoA dehydrogenase
LVSGELVGAYALSESGAGSDALGAAARATPTAHGFSLNGEKMWITNGGFADLFIVFAKVNGEQFTAFIVERSFSGVSTGQEEHKMGLHGSSTTPLILQNVHVPAANVLGEIGRGHKVAFNVLNFGRFKLGAMCLGGVVSAIGESARYAASRRQFGKAIAEFGAIKHKLGEMTVRAYAFESLMYRTAGLLDSAIRAAAGVAAVPAVMEEFAIEASIAKVAGSETLGYVLDENVQIHGGNGFVSDYPAERHYRDARVNRIFEGTNEINRLLIPGMLIKRSLKGDLPLLTAAKRLQDEVMTAGDAGSPIDAFKKVVLMTLGLALQRHGDEIADQQEILLSIADIVIETACAESAMMRSSMVPGNLSLLHADAASVFVNDAALRIDASARHVLAALAEGDALRTHLAALRRLLKVVPVDTVVRRRRLADETIRRGSYIFQ